MAFFSKFKRTSGENPSREDNLTSTVDTLPPSTVTLADKKTIIEEEPRDNGSGASVIDVSHPPAAKKRPTGTPSRRKAGRRASDQLRPIMNKVLSAESMDRLLFSLTEDLKNLFDCEEVTIYALDRLKRQLYSKNIKSDRLEEIRVDISPRSLAGFVAATGQTLNIVDAYDKKELSRHHPELSLDQRWDKQLDFQTRSALVVALPHQTRLMGVLQVLNKKTGKHFTEEDAQMAKELSTTLGHAMLKLELEEIEDRIQTTAYAIHSAETIDEILIELQIPILRLFDATLIAIYAVDEKNNEIYSKIKTGDAVKEIRLSLSPKSIAGCVGMVKKPINIPNVYNQKALSKYHPDLVFDSSWDKKSGFKTKSMLVHPILHEGELMGVLQLVNKRHGERFTLFDEKHAKTIASTLALAFFNQRKVAQQKPSKFGYLLQNGLISQDELNAAISKSRTSRMDIEDILLEELKLNPADLGKSYELFYKVPYYGYEDSIVLPQDVFSGLNRNFLTKNTWVPLQNDPNKAIILIDDPENEDKIRNIRMIFPRKEIELRVGLKADIRNFLNSAMGMVDEPIAHVPPTEEMSSLLDALHDEKSVDVFEASPMEEEELSAISETDSTIVRLVNKILIDAYEQGVSDIHIEPGMGKKEMKVRFRKDGYCRVYNKIPFLYKQAVISRIKIMSKLDIAERRKPQDGKIRMKYGRKEVEYRVATCPTVGGNEDAVLRILPPNEPLPLEKLNFSKRNLKLILDKVTKPHGLILVVGPTGSGKTTTLHSCLGHLNTPEKKIWTAEDPVEITQEGLRQVQTMDKIGLDFAAALRSFLRGDPDVIMVGEMRDEETCRIALEASLTGHLVLSTLHTNSAPETIVRLLDMGMNPLNFSDALLLIVAQRLVRTLCNTCKEDYHPSREEFETLEKEYGEKQFKELGIKYSSEITLKKPAGCSKCNGTGYADRTALQEVLEATPEIKSLIIKRSPVKKLRAMAIQEGMRTLKQDGIRKTLNGYCDLKSVLSICTD